MINYLKKNQLKFAPIYFLAPTIILFSLYVIYPIIDSIWVSFHSWNGMDRSLLDSSGELKNWKWVGLENYRELFFDDYTFPINIINNFKWLILSLLVIPIGLGLAIFLNFFGMPRSAPLVGGMVLSLMTLPTIIISSRAALKSVPPSIKEGALGLGASNIQAVFHHVVPVALPGMLTGTIIGMAQALGESAPLLIIGMVAFIVDIPSAITDPATALPIQIYLWADTPERGFIERTSAAIMVLLVFFR